ncbi:MAG: TonB-dependent receptor plug domain-containing protein, partial [Chlorobiales bacterium]|nr:TonB-dependent receptor plug domain-containing protein [Chlorobiales bacterium]
MLAAFFATTPVGSALAESSAEVEKIIVSATKTPHTLGDVPVAAEVITREELQERNVRTVQEALEISTTLVVESTSGYNNRGLIGMQGLEPRHTLVLIDGQRVQGGHQ